MLKATRFVLLTGLPGIGKTSVTAALPRPFYHRVHFGAALRGAVEVRVGHRLTHEEFRERFSSLLDAEVLFEASVLARREADTSAADVCVLDSHAVTPTSVGLLVTPDDRNRMDVLRFDAIIHLGLSGCVDRVLASGGVDGRFVITDVEAATAEQVQLATVVMYAASYNCPLTVVRAHGTVQETAQRVDAAIRSSLKWRDP